MVVEVVTGTLLLMVAIVVSIGGPMLITKKMHDAERSHEHGAQHQEALTH